MALGAGGRNPAREEGPAFLRGLSPAPLSGSDRAFSFLQSGFWGSFKARFGWRAFSFRADWGSAGETSLLVINRSLGPGFSLAYAPRGPELPGIFPPGDGERNRALVELARALGPCLPGSVGFIRFEPPWYSEGSGTPPPPVYPPFRRAGADVQAPDTALVDLAGTEEEILARMKEKWRYNIRLAAKKGVEVRRLDEAGLDTFLGLLRETARRDGIAIHGGDYYAGLFALGREYGEGAPEIRLYAAFHEGEALGAVVTLFRGDEGVYLYGASSNNKRNFMAPYLLQWAAMRDARAAGCRYYDLFGIPPGDDPAHPMAGLYRFKTGFIGDGQGGRIIHRPGSWDFVRRPLWAGLFGAAEFLRKKAMNLRRRFRG